MGLVIPFKPAGRKTMRRNYSGAVKSADILFFTGVRYYRREAAPVDGERPTDGRASRTRRAVKRRA